MTTLSLTARHHSTRVGSARERFRRIVRRPQLRAHLWQPQVGAHLWQVHIVAHRCPMALLLS